MNTTSETLSPNAETGVKKIGKVIYAYDPICGWCYAFAPQMEALRQKWGDKLDFEILSGGMVTGERVAPIGRMASYLKDALPRVEQMTGVRFGEPYKKNVFENGGPMIFGSEPGAKALTVVKSLQPEQGFAFAKAIQNAIFVEGADPMALATYTRLLPAFGISEAEFVERFNQPQYAELTRQEFVKVSNMGVQGFPTVLVWHKGKLTRIGYGYAKMEELDRALKRIVE